MPIPSHRWQRHWFTLINTQNCHKNKTHAMNLKLVENWRESRSDGISRQNPLWSKKPPGSLVLFENVTYPAAFFVSYFVYICDYSCYNFCDLYHRTCFTQWTQILHALLTYIAMSNKAPFECSNIRIFEYSTTALAMRLTQETVSSFQRHT